MTVFRKLEHHVIVGSAGAYHLEGRPEVTIRRYRGTGGFVGWLVSAPGLDRQSGVCSDFADVDRTLLRFGYCHDCGTWGRRHGHPDRIRCHECNATHEADRLAWAEGVRAVRAVEAAWALAEAMRAPATTREAVELYLAGRS